MFVIELGRMFNHLSLSQKGMLLALVGFTSYAISDVCAKWLAQSYSIYQTIAFNNLFACVFLLLALPWLGGMKALLSISHKRFHILRAVLNITVSLLIMQAYVRLPIADVYTFIFAMPFYAALLAIPLYKEQVTKSRWIAIIIGFSGVLLALQPGGHSFDMDLLWPLACGVVIALMFTISKSMQDESLFALGFWPVTANVLFASGMVVWGGSFANMSSSDLALFAINGALIASGIVCVSNAFRIAPAAAVSPFLYTEMVWALLFGYLIFGDVPNGIMLAGAGVIILSGFYLIETERRNGQKKRN